MENFAELSYYKTYTHFGKGYVMDYSRVWRSILGGIELSVSRGVFQTYFTTSKLIEIKGDTATVGVKSPFAIGQIERKFTPLIIEHFQKNKVAVAAVTFTVIKDTIKAEDVDALLTNEEVKPVRISPPSNPNAVGPAAVFEAAKNQPLHSGLPSRPELNKKYSFENFVVGAGNELAFAACQSVVLDPGSHYNPLYLYGGVGIGKTHLMHAVGNALRAKQPGINIVYINTENFVKEFVSSLRHKTTDDFTKFYRSADVLIVDDIQFIAGKEKVQEEFFHTFNSLHMANRQILMSSDKPPNEIPLLEDRLSSRFAWGMSLDMQIPDFETRCAIAQTKAIERQAELPIDVIEFMANRYRENIRELEGGLNQLLAHSQYHHVSPNLDIARAVLENKKSRPKYLSAKQVIERTARHFHINTEEILGPKRDKYIVLPRQIAMYLMREELHLSYPIIARELGRKDHTTAMHSVEKIMKEVASDDDIRGAVNDIKELLYA